MNQILITINDLNYNKNVKYKKFYLSLFFTFITLCVIIPFYLFFSYLGKINETQKTNILKNKYNINTLYSSSTSYTTLKLSNNISIIGSIKIPKIDISYPILENTNSALLKVSVCKFYGPFPNRIGNLCIAGHNYKNSSMFSNLHKLDIGDFFYITDLNNTRLKYIIYDKFIVNKNNLECIKNVNRVEVTLITCDNLDNSKRLVIKAKAEG